MKTKKVKLETVVLIRQFRSHEFDVPVEWDLDNLTEEQETELHNLKGMVDEHVEDEEIEDEEVICLEEIES